MAGRRGPVAKFFARRRLAGSIASTNLSRLRSEEIGNESAKFEELYGYAHADVKRMERDFGRIQAKELRDKLMGEAIAEVQKVVRDQGPLAPIEERQILKEAYKRALREHKKKVELARQSKRTMMNSSYHIRPEQLTPDQFKAMQLLKKLQKDSHGYNREVEAALKRRIQGKERMP